ncbi:MAG: ribosomal protein methylthiotransferase [Clostridiales bacterium]|nr:ribosomal protein methylthiotransferase [Clostridiales bacterium]
MKKVYIETLGCSKNQVDSEQMLGILDESHELSEAPEDADIVIVNTCSFIGDAKEESVDVILSLAELKKSGGIEKLIVTGCLAQRYATELVEEIPEIDALIGTGNFYTVDSVVQSLYDGTSENQKLFIDSVDLMVPEDLPRILTTPSHYAYLKIAEGCDNRCTYCIIPKLRGRYRSRHIEDIVEEARELASVGVAEFILIAQDSSRYGIDLYDKPMLPNLLEELSRVEAIKWIRVHYCYPDIMDEALIEGFTKHPKVINYFDIPIQHASDSVLKRMNRKTTQASIRNTIRMIREKAPDAVIRTTVIVGFPGETESDFEELMAFIKEIRFERLGAFKYSNEEDTPAFLLPDQVPEEIAEERRDALMAAQMEISEDIFYHKLGKVYQVVVEEVAEPGEIYIGRTAYDTPEIDGVVYIHTKSELELGSFIDVKITDALEYDLIGEVYDENEHR